MLKHKIILTGGHAGTTALATVEALRKQNIEWEIYWVGSKYPIEGKNIVSLEFKTLPKANVRCCNIISGKLQRRWTRYSLISLLKIPLGFVHAFFIIVKIQPKVIVSFGGFAAFPVVVVAWLIRIPILIHEQTAAAGLANRLSAPFANKVAISRKESRKYFPENKVVLVGNPIQESFFRIKPKKRISKLPVIFITGGSRGSQFFNRVIFDCIDKIVRKYKVIHQCGDLDFKQAQELRKKVQKKFKNRYIVYPSIPVDEMYKYFDKADIIIGRAGANTVSEIIAARRPAIFVPIPWVQNNEQYKNASLAADSGLAIIVEQDKFTAKSLLKAISLVKDNWKNMASAKCNLRGLDRRASYQLAVMIQSLI